MRLATWFVPAALSLLVLFNASEAGTPLVDKAREQIGVTKSYDPAYRKLTYPGGDVPVETGVCSDVVVRAFRGMGMDLQKAVHEDMAAAFDQYPKRWGLKRPDRNIDHRRVPNLMTYFKRQGWFIKESSHSANFRAGDIVAWDLGGGVTHIGIVSDRRSADGVPLIVHNIGGGACEENILFKYEVIGHYRPRFKAPAVSSPSRQGANAQ